MIMAKVCDPLMSMVYQTKHEHSIINFFIYDYKILVLFHKQQDQVIQARVTAPGNGQNSLF